MCSSDLKFVGLLEHPECCAVAVQLSGLDIYDEGVFCVSNTGYDIVGAVE